MLALASFLSQIANAQGNGTSVEPAIYHPRTIARIGVGAAGGAAVGAVVGGGPGAAIGAVAGAGAGAIYDKHERNKGR